ncbi:universal stress protein [Pseudoxanthobacter sp.]|uniref:universal stress protein n=1 Tax=Pseudoxanthobacter sp. TaxID=1925742 RepID=UPI002FE22FCD
MRYLAGYASDRSGADALALARMLTTGSAVDLTVCVVVPEPPRFPAPARVRDGYTTFLQTRAGHTLTRAAGIVGPEVAATYTTRPAVSAAEGLMAAADETAAGLVVLGSARSGPVLRCSFGSVAAAVVARARRPVALAPRGFRAVAGERLGRVTCAFTEAGGRHTSFATAADMARRHKVPLRLVTFAVPDRQMYPVPAGSPAPGLMADALRRRAEEAQARALASLPADMKASAVIVDGSDWKKALTATPWEPDEVLVVGARRTGGVAGWLFGSAFTRIMRFAMVPVIVAP